VTPDGHSVVRVWRGGESALGHGAAGDAECGDEGDPVRVAVSVLGGLDHESADRVVAAQVAPDFLFDQVRGSGCVSHLSHRGVLLGRRCWASRNVVGRDPPGATDIALHLLPRQDAMLAECREVEKVRDRELAGVQRSEDVGHVAGTPSVIDWRRLRKAGSALGSDAGDNSIRASPRHANDDTSHDEEQNKIQRVVHLDPSLEFSSKDQQAPVQGEMPSNVRYRCASSGSPLSVRLET
jgi:hypothetical protein